MFFSDGQDRAAGANEFLANFGSGEHVAPTDDITPEPISQDDAPDTDDDSPQETDDGQDFSAEDFIAAQIADSLDEDGIEVPGPDDETEPDAEPDDQGPIDFDNLSPEELQALAKEFQDFKAEQARSQVDRQLQLVQAKAAEAEAAAMAEVERAFEAQVLTKSADHYKAWMNQRISTLVKAAKQQDDPDTYTIQGAIAEAMAMFESRMTYERQKFQDWNAIAERARVEARQRSPEVRHFVAQHFAQKFGLPEEVVADIAHPNRHITAFEQRAQELADIAKSMGKERKKSANDRRQNANRELQRTTVRTSSTGRRPGGKAREWKDLGEQDRKEAGAEVLRMFHSRN